MSMSSPDLIKNVKPNLKREVIKYKVLLVFSSLLIIFGFLGFILSSLLTSTNDFESFPTIVIFPIICFFCFPVGGTLTGAFKIRLSKVKYIYDLSEKLNGFDSILIERFFSNTFIKEIDKLLFVQKLIATGNLPNHEIVANVLVAKKVLRISEADARQQYAEYMCIKNGTYVPPINVTSSDIFPEIAAEIITHCPGCGALIEENGSNFCQYCGRRLK